MPSPYFVNYLAPVLYNPSSSIVSLVPQFAQTQRQKKVKFNYNILKMEAIFSVIFFDGECETNIGHVVVYPSLDYKTLQSLLSHRIGISPSQFSVHLADAKTSRKIPITGRANFSAICRETDCFFLVSLRRSQDSRSRRQRRQQPEKQPAANAMLLKRNSDVRAVNNNNVNKNNNWNGLNGDVLVCEECLRAKETGRDFGFHGCVYDAVTYGFRSTAGPIARPVKKSVQGRKPVNFQLNVH